MKTWHQLGLIILLSFISASSAIVNSPNSGFLSLDCGLPEGESYEERNSISWVSDAAYIGTGKVATVRNIIENFTHENWKTLRYFPYENRSKSCYIIGNILEGRDYLVRAWFFYGNYDGLNTTSFSFSVAVDENAWPVHFDVEPKNPSFHEWYVPAKRDAIAVCLAKTGETTPFISSLELRPLNSNLHVFNVIQNKYAAKTIECINYGSYQYIYRHPYDAYDRQWLPNTRSPKTITNTMNISIETIDQPPIRVLQTSYGDGNLTNLTLHIVSLPSTMHFYYLALYFAEIGDAERIGERKFKILLNDESLLPEATLDILNRTSGNRNTLAEVYSTTPIALSSSLNISLVQLPGSTYGPIINALELFMISDQLNNATFRGDVLAIQDLQKTLGALSDWSGDPCFPYAFNWLSCNNETPPRITELILTNHNLSGMMPTSINSLTSLTKILLSENSLNGHLPDLSSLKNLQILNLSSNNFNGQIPNTLGSLPNLIKLLLDDNDFSGAIPQALIEKSRSGTLSLSFKGNRYPDTVQNATSTSSNKGLVIPTLVWIGIPIICVVLGIVAFILIKQRWLCPTQELESHDHVHEKASSRAYTYKELKEATTNFNNKIGVGGFGEVFYGTLPNNKAIAAKKLSEKKSKASGQGIHEFSNEVEFLSRIHHRNLVSFLGYCLEKELILVYEYMPGGNLHDMLHGRERKNHLDWKARLAIALDSALGLDYLHRLCDPMVIHRDIKSRNILLDDRMRAKVSDFGLSKSKASEKDSHVFTMARGTWGYMDPEYAARSRLTEKSDVYSFGVVLLELVCGRPPQDLSDSDQPYIKDWVNSHMERSGDVKEIVDPVLGSEYSFDSMCEVVKVALNCTKIKGIERPSMKEVVNELTHAIELECSSRP